MKYFKIANGKKRYWHMLFTKGKHYLNYNKNHTYWVLRENLRLALSQYLEHFGCTCKVCGFNPEEIYGKEFLGIINVHHLRPLNESEGEYSIDPIADLIPLCRDCRAAVHKRAPPYALKKIKEIIKPK